MRCVFLKVKAMDWSDMLHFLVSELESYGKLLSFEILKKALVSIIYLNSYLEMKSKCRYRHNLGWQKFVENS